jgi:BASS family bile acid:Na+ symporter
VESNVFTAVLMPIALGVIMLGLGLSLQLEDFKRVVLIPKPVFVGLLCQMLLLPVVCFAIAVGFELPPALAVGLMLLAASPGGATANLFSHLAKGDVALNITLTAVNSVLSLLTLPFIVNYSLVHFMGEGKVIPLQFDKVVQVFSPRCSS